MICIETIKERKAVYGNNFPELARLQSEFLGFEITPQQVAYNLAILKQVRIDFIKSKLQELKDVHTNNMYEVNKLIEALEDSKKDFENYKWIANNYKEYEEL